MQQALLFCLYLFGLLHKCSSLINSNNIFPKRISRNLCLFGERENKFVYNFRPALIGACLFIPGFAFSSPQINFASDKLFIGSAMVAPFLLNSLEYSELASPKILSSIENIIRVYKSLKYIQEDIESKGDSKSVIAQIKVLLKNYNLKENIINSLEVVSKDKAIRNEAKFHGTSAVEDLSQVYEYFSDEIDNMSGNKFPPRQILSFALDATKAARGY